MQRLQDGSGELNPLEPLGRQDTLNSQFFIGYPPSIRKSLEAPKSDIKKWGKGEENFRIKLTEISRG
jgi:hypothetical protein